MSEVLWKALTATQSNKVMHAALDELSRGPDEAKSAITESFELVDPDSSVQMPSFQLLLTRLPQISGALGKDYQRKVTKQSLFHPAAPDYDSVLLFHTGILRYLEDSPHDETAVLDRLIEQGRVEAGSDFEREWRDRLSADMGSRESRLPPGERTHDPASATPSAGEDEPPGDSRGTVFAGVIAVVVLLTAVAVWLARRFAAA